MVPGWPCSPCIWCRICWHSGELIAVLPDWQPASMGIHALYPSRRQLPLAMRSLLDFLQQHFSQRPILISSLKFCRHCWAIRRSAAK
jgi:DNA-binding transcriptional LysR family regulator